MSDSSSLCEDSDSSREDASDSSSEDTSEEFSGFDEEFGLRRYQFEPELDISVSSSGDESSEGSEKSNEMLMTKRTTALQIQIGKYYF